MLESEIKEQLETQKKNIQYLKDTIKEIDALPEQEGDKRADEYFFCIDRLQNTNCLDDEITKKRLQHEEGVKLNEETSSELYLETDLYPAVIQHLISEDLIFKVNNKVHYRDKVYTTTILRILVEKYYKDKSKFEKYTSRERFKEWVIGLYQEMDIHVSKNTVKKGIDRIVREGNKNAIK